MQALSTNRWLSLIHILDDPALSDEIGEEFKSQLMDEIELLDGASADFDMELVTRCV